MFRIDDPTAAAALPIPEAAGTPGYFTEGSPGATPPTLVRASFLNMLQEEFIAVCAAAGIAPSKTTYNQLLTALRSAGVFTTPAQFDTSTKVATMAAVQRALGNFAGIIGYSNSQSLTVSQFGNFVEFYGSSPATFTLPLLSALPPLGGAYFIKNDGTAPLTVTRSGADLLVGIGGATSVVLGVGDTLHIFGIPTSWYVVGGSAQLPYAPGFGASLAASGYQKLPSGLIIQWGSGNYTSAGTIVTFPIAFNAVPYVVGLNNNGSVNVTYTAATLTTTTFTASTNNATAFPGSWVAIGR